MVNSPLAAWMQQMHPLRVQYEFFSDANRLMKPVADMGEQARKNRKPASKDNPFVAMQENMSEQIVSALDSWRNMAEATAERMFLTIYGLPRLQAAVGIDPQDTRPQRKAAKNPLHRALAERRIAELKARIPSGGLREAVMRAVLYVGAGRGSVDERGFEMVRRIRRAHGDLPLAEFKTLLRDQFFMLLIDEKAALAAIPRHAARRSRCPNEGIRLDHRIAGRAGRHLGGG
jgi:hypothetical protein